MHPALAYVVTELTDTSAPTKFPGASLEDMELIARRILEAPENAWQRAIQKSAYRCAALIARPG